MTPPKSIEAQIDEAIEVDINVWVEDKQQEPEQTLMFNEEENG